VSTTLSRIGAVLALMLLALFGTAGAASATTADTTAPSAPGGLTASKSGNDVVLNWSASTDDVGVAGYEVSINDGAPFSVGTALSYTHAGQAGKTNTYKVRAFDGAGNRSAFSSTAYSYASPGTGSLGTELSANVGKQVIDGAISLAPIMVPFILALLAIAWVMKKFGLRKRASLNV
jgi:hypothetical protein